MKLKDILVEKQYSKLLYEIGEGSTGVYKTKRVGEEKKNFAKYIKEDFETEKEEYRIKIFPTYFDLDSRERKNISHPSPRTVNVFKVSFEAKGKSVSKVVGVNNPLKVINTVFRTALKVYKEFEDKVRGFIFEASGSPVKSSQREKIYKRFIENQFENVRFVEAKNEELVVLIE